MQFEFGAETHADVGKYGLPIRLPGTGDTPTLGLSVIEAVIVPHIATKFDATNAKLTTDTRFTIAKHSLY